jgi:hypothetical protein
MKANSQTNEMLKANSQTNEMLKDKEKKIFNLKEMT